MSVETSLAVVLQVGDAWGAWGGGEIGVLLSSIAGDLTGGGPANGRWG